ncbi:MAG TPA: SAM-dependent methyltransferase [Solirubrobacteraceae bacterium]|nr:SAM-dependent methyltransferase [Solirubrobacteraceae bacterium]
MRQAPPDRDGRPGLTRPARRPLKREVARRWPELAEQADALIAAGAVHVGGLPATNPRTLVAATDSVRLAGDERTLRGRVKLAAALEGFGVDARGAVALDAGAAAGGFVQALLDAGARRVYAVEAGFGQLLGSLAQDERVVSLERTNVGALDRALVPDPLDLVTLDVGYLPLAAAVPQLGVLRFAPGARLVGLVKPKDELGLGALPADPDGAVEEAVARASAGIAEAGWEVAATMRSPVTGARGAVEAFVLARRG